MHDSDKTFKYVLTRLKRGVILTTIIAWIMYFTVAKIYRNMDYTQDVSKYISTFRTLFLILNGALIGVKYNIINVLKDYDSYDK